jgi:hypothetical protein
MPCANQFADALRRQANAVFLRLDFLGNADSHADLLNLLGGLCQKRGDLRQSFAPELCARAFRQGVFAGANLLRKARKSRTVSSGSCSIGR